VKTTLAASLLIPILGGAPVWAVLGEHESSVSADQQLLRGTDREEVRQGYKVHQITAPDGSAVKEFISPVGLVFEVAWQSPQMPNLQQLLGSNMTQLQVALQSQTRRHTRGPLIVRTDNLVLVSSGHMRSFHGFAYVPSLVPPNVSPETVQ
jgi:hypothetical protein